MVSSPKLYAGAFIVFSLLGYVLMPAQCTTARKREQLMLFSHRVSRPYSPQRHKGHEEIQKIFVSFVSLW